MDDNQQGGAKVHDERMDVLVPEIHEFQDDKQWNGRILSTADQERITGTQ
jgi:hypothetical protein